MDVTVEQLDTVFEEMRKLRDALESAESTHNREQEVKIRIMLHDMENLYFKALAGWMEQEGSKQPMINARIATLRDKQRIEIDRIRDQIKAFERSSLNVGDRLAQVESMKACIDSLDGLVRDESYLLEQHPELTGIYTG